MFLGENFVKQDDIVENLKKDYSKLVRMNKCSGSENLNEENKEERQNKKQA